MCLYQCDPRSNAREVGELSEIITSPFLNTIMTPEMLHSVVCRPTAPPRFTEDDYFTAKLDDPLQTFKIKEKDYLVSSRAQKDSLRISQFISSFLHEEFKSAMSFVSSLSSDATQPASLSRIIYVRFEK